MEINISGHHLEVTDPIREYAQDKIGGLEKFDHDIVDIEIILSVDKTRQKAEAKVNVPHTTLFAEAVTEDIYSAIDELRNKLAEQIKKHKSKHQNPRDKRNEKLQHEIKENFDDELDD
tara:strand:+ start:33655 stop:34008 length:354 start_codon:yes stop_codon:yes gene_type:complete